MTCKNCVHYDVCLLGACIKGITGTCLNFKDKSSFIELPCKVGDIIYQIDGVRIYASTIHEITYTSSKVIFVTENIVFDEQAINNSIFLTREEAEKALERSKGNA